MSMYHYRVLMRANNAFMLPVVSVENDPCKPVHVLVCRTPVIEPDRTVKDAALITLVNVKVDVTAISLCIADGFVCQSVL